MIKKKKVVLVLCLIIVAIFFGYCFTGNVPTIYRDISGLEISNELPTTASVLWPQKESDVSNSGEGVGVAADASGNIYYLNRGSNIYGSNQIIAENVILKINPDTEEVIGSYGANFFMSPHGLEVDIHGNMWVTDVGLNKIIKLNPDGQIVFEYGDDYPFYLDTLYRIKNKLPRFPLFVSNTTFARPTDVVAQDNGDFIVTDGYRNNRIARFNSSGELVWQVNKSGNESGAFNLPHGLTQDEEGKLYVADRQNSRIQIFSSSGEWIESWESPELGRPYAIDFAKDGNLYIADGGDMLDGGTDTLRSSIVIADKNGNIIGRFGSYGDSVGQLNIPHDIAVGEDGNIYIAELNNYRLQKFTINETGL